ncbi:MAG: hypothetical protein ACREQ9_20665 [Candidatus Binatia bacterium]
MRNRRRPKRSELRWSDTLIILGTILFLALALGVQVTYRPADLPSPAYGSERVATMGAGSNLR